MPDDFSHVRAAFDLREWGGRSVNVLSVVRAMGWSWGLSSYQIEQCWPQGDKLIRIMGYDGHPVSDDLVEFFDVTLLQNAELIDSVKRKSKVVARMGGMIIDETYKVDRFGEQLAQVGAVIADVRPNGEKMGYGFVISSGHNDVPEGQMPCIFTPGLERCARDKVQEDVGKLLGRPYGI